MLIMELSERFEKLMKVKKQKEEELIRLSGQLVEKQKDLEKATEDLLKEAEVNSVEEAEDKIRVGKEDMETFITKAEEILKKYGV